MSDQPKRRPPPRSRAAAGASRAARAAPARRANPLLAALSPSEEPAARSGPGTAPHEVPGSAQDEAYFERTSEPGAPDRPAAHGRAICTVGLCPICTFVTALDEVRPELTEHLLLAGREVLLAVRALIDARLEATRDRVDGEPQAQPDDPAPPPPAQKPRRRRGGVSRTSPLEQIVIG